MGRNYHGLIYAHEKIMPIRHCFRHLSWTSRPDDYGSTGYSIPSITSPKGQKRCIHEEAHPLCIYLYLRICHGNACPASEYAPYETATGSTEIEVVTVNYAAGTVDTIHRGDAVDIVKLPVIAAGGIPDGRGLAAAFARSRASRRNPRARKPARYMPSNPVRDLEVAENYPYQN
jgi:hypothetical protein